MNRKPGSHLTQLERCQIYTLKKRGDSSREIGRALGVSHTTIIRELNRNRGGCGYRFQQAHCMAVERRHRASKRPYRLSEELKARVKHLLLETQWSPEQIAGRMKREGILISHETIYRLVRCDRQAGGSLYQQLRHRGKRYNKRLGKLAGRGYIPGRVDISERPKVVESKSRVGDIELDTIIGARHKGALVSMVDRATKFTYLRRVEGTTAAEVAEAITEALKPLSQHGMVKTLTADNGKEFAWHSKITEVLGGGFYFAKPYRSWERGLNEHTNGLVRQYFPKGTDLTTLTEEEVAEVEHKLNNRPRKCLNFETPAERLLKLYPHLEGGAFHC